jgi:hypothetical protein
MTKIDSKTAKIHIDLPKPADVVRKIEAEVEQIAHQADEFVQNAAKNLPVISLPPLPQLPPELHLYPTANQWAARTAEIAQAVDKMGLGEGQRTALQLLENAGVSTVDLWQGSHTVFDGDQGKLYDQLLALGAEPRGSSHYPNVPTQQYQIAFGDAALLFGKDANGNTWVQMEGHAFHGRAPHTLQEIIEAAKANAGHALDTALYYATGRTSNVGPLGMSPHTELSNALHVPYKE